MARLEYNHSSKTIDLYNRDGAKVGTWPANNNVDSAVGITSLPNGVYSVKDQHRPHKHPGDSSKDAYGPAGIMRLRDFVHHGRVHDNVGIHSGRKGVPDKAGRTGVDHATRLCIRTTDAAMSMISQIAVNDPFESLLV